ncbi:hypothetical protein [Streptomyces sp. SYP-A7185]|uniref:hypothetical protein n=1 Tax=Streptomyces sp. SYP-A7185 TaxID=3040076 RepID=UPI0038F5E80C
MQEFLEQIEIREAAGRDLADRLRTQIAELTAQLAAAEQMLERLKITRETILEIAPDLPGGLAPLPRPTARSSPSSKTPRTDCTPRTSASPWTPAPSPVTLKGPAPN